MENLFFIVMIGVGATVTMDLWCILRKALFDISPPNYGLVGRWIAYMPKGQLRHVSIATSPPIDGERFIGWTAHYLTGIAFAAILVSITGEDWFYNPTMIPALAVGIGTVAAPFLLMQPGMGAGFAAPRTQNPKSVRLQSIISHAVFGFGLYISGWAANLFWSM